jgi:NADPH:quinone reductase-like Zn-dependent oxidoreductase
MHTRDSTYPPYFRLIDLSLTAMSSQTHLAFASTAIGITSVIRLPTASPGPGEVMVKVAFSSVIPLDTYMVNYGRNINGNYPVVLGFNLSGVVDAVGSGVDDLQTGDKASINICVR